MSLEQVLSRLEAGVLRSKYERKNIASLREIFEASDINALYKL